MARHPKERPSSPHQMNRRDFLRTGATAAAGIPVAGALLAACGGGTSTDVPPGGGELQLARPDNPVTLPLYDSNPPIADGLQPEQDATLKLYNYDQYIWKKVADDFGKKYNCKVEISTFNNADEAASKLRAGQADFDVFFPSDDVIEKYVVTQLLRPLNHSYLPNLAKNTWPQFSAPDQPFYDVGQRYTVPYSVWTTGIGWRNDLVDPSDAPDAIDNPYDILWNPTYKGKLSLYDDYRETITAALLRNGVTDVNTGDPAAINAARDALLETVKTTNVAFTTNGAYEDLPKGVFYASLAWAGDIVNARWYGKGSPAETAPLLSYWWPTDKKGVVGNDNMTIMKGGKNPVLAHLFLNYMLDFDVAMKNFSWIGYQPPQNDAPPEAFKDPKSPAYGLVPPNLLNCVVRPEDFDTGYQELELAPDVDALWHDAWEQVTAGN
jgi:spermidine/putrescine transport system substrate-binding protein